MELVCLAANQHAFSRNACLCAEGTHIPSTLDHFGTAAELTTKLMKHCSPAWQVATETDGIGLPGGKPTRIFQKCVFVCRRHTYSIHSRPLRHSGGTDDEAHEALLACLASRDGDGWNWFAWRQTNTHFPEMRVCVPKAHIFHPLSTTSAQR